MKIIYIGLMLTTDDLDVHELKSDFGFLNRFIGNYLTRIAKGSGYISEDYNRIVIIAQTGDIKRPYIEDKFLKIEVGFNREEYLTCARNDLPVYFSKMYLGGFEQASQLYTLPYELLIQSLTALKTNDYKNEWDFKSKAIRKIDASITLHCKMTMDYFSLTAVIMQKEKKLLEKEVLRTLPDELMFAKSFKDVVFEDDCFVILDFLKDPYATISWPSLELTYSQEDVARL